MSRLLLNYHSKKIDAIKTGIEEDKKRDLKVEAIQLDTDESAEAPDTGGGGDLFGGGGGDLFGGGEGNLEGGEESPEPPAPEAPVDLAEKNILSIRDEDAPIKVSNAVSRIDALLSEGEEDDKKDKNDSDMSEIEFKIKEKQRKSKYYKRSKKKDLQDTDIAGLNKNQSKDSTTGVERLMADLRSNINPKSDYNPDLKFEMNRDEINIDEYLDSKIAQNATMTNTIKSTLNSLQDYVNSKPRVISENNSSGEKDE